MSQKPERMRKEADDWRKDKAMAYKEYIRTSAVGLEVGLSVVVGIVAGFLFDDYFKTDPWGIIVGFLLGGAAAGRRLYVFSKRYLKENAPDSPAPSKKTSDYDKN